MIIFDAGMRPEEVFRMQIRHIDFMGSNITVEHGKTAKASRCVPLSDRCMEMLKVRISGKDPEDWVFPSARAQSGHIVTWKSSSLPSGRRGAGQAFRALLGTSHIRDPREQDREPEAGHDGPRTLGCQNIHALHAPGDGIDSGVN